MSTELRWTLGKSLPVILIAAVVQGWALYALYMAVRGSYWPATDLAALYPLYAVAVFVPLTVMVLADHVDKRVVWWVAATLAVLYAYFGWFEGAHISPTSAERTFDGGRWLATAFVLAILWLLIMPFVKSRLSEGTWRVGYGTLFASAWRNKVLLAEAALFTGLFWIILFLWRELFHMLGIDFFRELFEEPLFVYPVTTLAFAIALHLIGSVDRLTSVLLEQVLAVLKWLALVAGLVVGLFTVALLVKLPGVISSGEKAISAAWLLWLIAVMVLLVNAAFRDGSIDRPYPRWIAFALRSVVPLLVIVAGTAIYALYVRIDAYGFTIERVWASIVAAAACVYACGYAIAAVRRGPWMGFMPRVNVFVALFLIGVIALTFTPLLSPARISADSQFRLATERPYPDPSAQFIVGRSPMHYLRFSAGRYGEERLKELAQLEDHPRANEIRDQAIAILAQKNAWERYTMPGVERALKAIPLYPAGRSLDDPLIARVQSDASGLPCFTCGDPAQLAAGAFLDLNGDGEEEFLLIVPPTVQVYARHANGWRSVGPMTSDSMTAVQVGPTIDAVRAGQVQVRTPRWQDVQIGDKTFRLEHNGWQAVVSD